jgi:hypothetical protein
MSCWFVVARVPDCVGMHNPHFRRGGLSLARGETPRPGRTRTSYRFITIVRRSCNRAPFQRLKPAERNFVSAGLKPGPPRRFEKSALGATNLSIRSAVGGKTHSVQRAVEMIASRAYFWSRLGWSVVLRESSWPLCCVFRNLTQRGIAATKSVQIIYPRVLPSMATFLRGARRIRGLVVQRTQRKATESTEGSTEAVR